MEIKKVVTVKLDGLNVSVSVDGDQDGEASIAMQVKLPEVFSEVIALFTKKPA
jgi:hypothetical protein